MRTCVEKKVVSRKDGSKQNVCAKWENTEDTVLARRADNEDEEDGDVGSLKIDVVRGFKGFDLSPKNILPSLLSAIAVEGTTLALRRYVMNSTVQNWAPAISILAGVAVSIPMRAWGGQKAMEDGIKTAVIVGGLHQLVDYLKPRLGLGLLVPQAVRGLVAERVGNLPVLPMGDGALPRQAKSLLDVSAYGKV